jgi:hypothetical protein
MSSVTLLPLCSIPKLADRDGGSGQYARLLLPFYDLGTGYWFASGQQFTFPGATVAQQRGITDTGVRQADTYVKDAGVCWNQ